MDKIQKYVSNLDVIIQELESRINLGIDTAQNRKVLKQYIDEKETILFTINLLRS